MRIFWYERVMKMNQILIYAAGSAPAIRHTLRTLEQRGLRIADTPGPDVTHLLLPVPSFESDGRIRGGGILEHILADLPEGVTVIGGNLEHPSLAGYHCIDLLRDGLYLAKNAAITADCAIRVATQRLPVVLDGCPILILGWGRIGKCLAAQLKAAGAAVTVAARKDADRHMLRALGYGAEDPGAMRHSLAAYRVIFNTVPAPVLDEERMAHCRRECLKIELASKPGIAGPDVISALALPGRMAPESSGLLIAQSVIRLIAEREGMK